jgi:hypothetical protein
MSRFGNTTEAAAAALPIVPIERLLRQVNPGNETAIDVVEKLLEDGTKHVTLAVQQRKLNPEAPPAPVRAPSAKRIHFFYDTAGFAQYLAKYGTENTVVLADPNEEGMTAVLNESAVDGYENVLFKPQTHPLFAPWEELLDDGGVVGIKDFVDFISRNRRAITNPHSRELMLLLSQVRMSREVELYVGDRNNSTNGILIKTNVQGNNASDYVDIPETITISVPIYVGTAAVDMEIDLTVGGNEQRGVIVKLSTGDVLAKKAQLFDTMVADLRTALPKATVTTGRVAYGTWDYLK